MAKRRIKVNGKTNQKRRRQHWWNSLSKAEQEAYIEKKHSEKLESRGLREKQEEQFALLREQADADQELLLQFSDWL